MKKVKKITKINLPPGRVTPAHKKPTMTNFEQLIESLKVATGVKYELHQNENFSWLQSLGIKIERQGQSVWHWFECHTLSTTGEILISFKHTYSQNTGATKKGLRHSMKIRTQIQKKLKLNFYL